MYYKHNKKNNFPGDFPEDRHFTFMYGGGREPRNVTTSTLLDNEFEFFRKNVGSSNTQMSSNKAHVGPIHRVLWVMPDDEVRKHPPPDANAADCLDVELIFTGAEDGDVKLWFEWEGGLTQARAWY
jgi:hypothetical protein